MSATFVQSASVQNIASSVTIAPIDTTSGNLLVAMIARKSAVVWSGSPVTDNYGNVWVLGWLDGNSHGVFGSGAFYYVENCVGGAGHTVTLTLPSGSSGIALAVGEFSGIVTSASFLGTTHTSDAGPGTAVPPIVSGNLAGITTGQLLIGAGTVSHGDQPPASTGLFTDLYAAFNGATEGVLFSYALVDAIDSYHYAFNKSTASAEGYGIATFRGSSIALVQSTGVKAGSVASATTPAITTSSGNFLVVVCALFAKSFSGSPVTDSYSNTWRLAWTGNGGAHGHTACYYVENCVGGAGHTVTLTPPGGNDFCAFGLGEFSGVALTAALDQTASANGSTQPYTTGSTPVTSQAEELLIGGGSVSSGGGLGYSTVPYGWTTVEALDESGGSSTEGVILAYQVAPADGTYEYGMNTGSTGSTSYEAVGIAAFMAAVSLECDDPDGRVGDVYAGALIATGGLPPYTYAIAAGSLPPGLALNASTGAITGTPTLEGVYPFTGQVTDDNGDTALCACVITILHDIPPADLSAETWVFDATESQWHQRASYDSGAEEFTRWRVRGCAAVGSIILVGDYATGDLYALDMETFTENGDAIKRVRRAPYLSSENQWVFVDRVELGLQSGVGNIAAPDPQVSIAFSRDGGANYDTPTDTSMGALGDDTASAVWRALGRVRADRLVVEVSTVEPVRIVWGPGLWFKVRQGTGQR